MAFPNRVLALAGCALFAAACTQDTTTAPPVAADVVAQGGTVLGPGSESGTITLTKVRGDETLCLVKVSMKGLFNDPNSSDDLYLLWQGWFPGTAWSIGDPIYDELISRRGTYSTQFTRPKGELFGYPIWLQYNVSTPVKIADFGTSPPLAFGNFKAVNRCWSQTPGEP